MFKAYFPTIAVQPRVIYPGINIDAYEATVDVSASEIIQVISSRPSFISLNRFEAKKNAALAVSAFAKVVHDISPRPRLVVAGGYDPRVEDNMMTLYSLIDLAKAHSLTYNVIAPASSRTNIPPLNMTPDNPDILFLLNFTMTQRTALLCSPNTLALLYTPANEHFGIGPVEGMIGGIPVLACNSGGPVESVVDEPRDARTGWLRPPEIDQWTQAMKQIDAMSAEERVQLSVRAKDRARSLFSMDAMAKDLESVLRDAINMGRPGYGVFVLLVLASSLLYIMISFVRFIST